MPMAESVHEDSMGDGAEGCIKIKKEKNEESRVCSQEENISDFTEGGFSAMMGIETGLEEFI